MAEEDWVPTKELYHNPETGDAFAVIDGEKWKVSRASRVRPGEFLVIKDRRHFDKPEEQLTYDASRKVAKDMSTSEKMAAHLYTDLMEIPRGLKQIWKSGDKPTMDAMREERIRAKALSDEMGGMAKFTTAAASDAPLYLLKAPKTVLQAVLQGARVGAAKGALSEKEEDETRLGKAAKEAVSTALGYGVGSKVISGAARLLGPKIAAALGKEEYRPPARMPWLTEEKIPVNIRNTRYGQQVLSEEVPEKGMSSDMIDKAGGIPEGKEPWRIEGPGFAEDPKAYLRRWLPDALFRTKNADEVNKTRAWKMANYWHGHMEDLSKKLGQTPEQLNEMLINRLQQDESGVMARRYGKPEELPRVLPAELESFYKKEMKPLIDDTARIVLKLRNQGNPLPQEISDFAEGYMPHMLQEKTPWYKSFLDGDVTQSTQKPIRSFKTSDPAMRQRRIKAVVGEQGQRYVIHERNGYVRVYENGELKPFGRLKEITNEDILDKELSPIEHQMQMLENELRIRTSSKATRLASSIRIKNIENELMRLEHSHAAVMDRFNPAELNKKTVVDGQGREWKIFDATLAEKEAATGMRYIKDPHALLAMKWLAMKRVETETAFLENFKKTPEFNRLSVEKSKFPAGPPEGMAPTKLWNFQGQYFDKRIAEILDDFAGKSTDGIRAAEAANNFLVRSIFWNPLPHDMNILSHWINQRGLTQWMFPSGYKELNRSMTMAIRGVLNQDENYIEWIREGGAAMANRVYNKELQDKLMKLAGNIVEKDPAWKEFIKEAGYKSHADFIKSWYEAANKGLWVPSDVMTYQATLEYMKRYGVSMRDAIWQVEKHMPNYRVPSRMFGTTDVGKIGEAGRTMSKAITNTFFSSFGRYHYGVVRSYSESMKDTAAMLRGMTKGKLPTGEQAHTMDQLAMLMVQLGVLYPLYSAAWKEATGNEHADATRFGAERLPYSLYESAKGERPLRYVMWEMFTPSPAARVAIELTTGKSMVTGKDIAHPSDITKGTEGAKVFAKDVGGYAASQIAPFQTGVRLYGEKDTPRQMMLRQIGIKDPTPEQAAKQIKAKAKEFRSDSKRIAREMAKMPEMFQEKGETGKWETATRAAYDQKTGTYYALIDNQWVKVRKAEPDPATGTFRVQR